MKVILRQTSLFSPEGACVKCGKPLVPMIVNSDPENVYHTPGFYCTNVNCLRYGLISVAIEQK